MTDEPDRVLTLSDLRAFEERLEKGLDSRFGARLEERLRGALADVRAMNAQEGVDTRRHLDVMVERMSDLMKRIADGFNANVRGELPTDVSHLENPEGPSLLP